MQSSLLASSTVHLPLKASSTPSARNRTVGPRRLRKPIRVATACSSNSPASSSFQRVDAEYKQSSRYKSHSTIGASTLLLYVTPAWLASAPNVMSCSRCRAFPEANVEAYVGGSRHLFFLAAGWVLRASGSRVCNRVIQLRPAGAVKYLQQRYDLTQVEMAGASGGALAALLAGCDVNADQVLEVRGHPRG
jgi:hypothetical protein